MTLRYTSNPHVAEKDRHVPRHGYQRGRKLSMKKEGSGKANWGKQGDEIDMLGISVNQAYNDAELSNNTSYEEQDEE